jgi:WD40 repeat protein
VFTLKHRKYYLECVAFSPDGRSLAACGGRGTVQVWDLDARRLKHHSKTGAHANGAASFTHDARRLLVLDYDTLHCFDFAAGTRGVLRSARAGREFVSAAFSPDRRRVCCTYREGLPSLPPEFGIEQYALPEFAFTWGAKRLPYLAAAYSADGRTLATDEGGNVALWDADAGVVTSRVEGTFGYERLALSPDGAVAAWVGSSLCFWRLDAGGKIRSHDRALDRTAFHSVACHPSGRFFATAKGDGMVEYWDARTGERLRAFDWGVGKVNDVTFDDAGDRAACCSQTGEVVVWDVDC